MRVCSLVKTLGISRAPHRVGQRGRTSAFATASTGLIRADPMTHTDRTALTSSLPRTVRRRARSVAVTCAFGRVASDSTRSGVRASFL